MMTEIATLSCFKAVSYGTSFSSIDFEMMLAISFVSKIVGELGKIFLNDETKILRKYMLEIKKFT